MYLEKDSISKLMNKFDKPNTKRKLNETTKKVVASNQQWKCNRCYILLNASYEVDHILPLYKGGNNDMHNLQALCRNCHGLKTINDKLNM
jgi:5-methylcytosine-specific restriction endonuclease McrA